MDHCPLSSVNSVLLSIALTVKTALLHIATGQVLSDAPSQQPVSGGEE